MKVYVKASVTDLKLSYQQIKEIEEGLYSIVKKYFHDGNYSSTRAIKVSESDYDLLRFTARPYCGYSGSRAEPQMNKDTAKLGEFRKEVRAFLKPYGVTRLKFNTSNGKLHYGYISGPDDFPVTYLNAIYFG